MANGALTLYSVFGAGRPTCRDCVDRLPPCRIRGRVDAAPPNRLHCEDCLGQSLAIRLDRVRVTAHVEPRLPAFRHVSLGWSMDQSPTFNDVHAARCSTTMLGLRSGTSGEGELLPGAIARDLMRPSVISRSRFHLTLVGSCSTSHWLIFRSAWNAASAAARSPRASATPPTRLWATARLRCQPVLVGSCSTSRRLMARPSWNAASAAARSPRPQPLRRHGCRRRRGHLPARVGGVLFDQPPDDGQALLERCLGGGEITACLSHSADTVVGDGEVALPARVGGVLFDQPPVDGQGLLERCLGGGEITARLSHSADTVVGGGEVICQPVLVGSCSTSRRTMARLPWNAASAAARSPRASATPPTRLWATAR